MKKIILFLCFFSELLFPLSYQSQKVKEKNLSWVQREKQIIKKFIDENPELLPQLATLTFATFMKLVHYCLYLLVYSHAHSGLIPLRKTLIQFENNINTAAKELESAYKIQKDIGNVIKVKKYAESISAPEDLKINITPATNELFVNTCKKIENYELEFDARLEQKEKLNNFDRQYYIQTTLAGLVVGSELGFIIFIITKYLIFRFSQYAEIDEESEFENLGYNERFKQFERSRKQQRKIHCG